MKKLYFKIITLFLLILPFSALANDMKTGDMYFEAEDYASAFEYYLSAAEKDNNSSAQNRLGTMYEKGLGVKLNNDKALEWYMKAAKNLNL